MAVTMDWTARPWDRERYERISEYNLKIYRGVVLPKMKYPGKEDSRRTRQIDPAQDVQEPATNPGPLSQDMAAAPAPASGPSTSQRLRVTAVNLAAVDAISNLAARHIPRARSASDSSSSGLSSAPSVLRTPSCERHTPLREMGPAPGPTPAPCPTIPPSTPVSMPRHRGELTADPGSTDNDDSEDDFAADPASTDNDDSGNDIAADPASTDNDGSEDDRDGPPTPAPCPTPAPGPTIPPPTPVSIPRHRELTADPASTGNDEGDRDGTPSPYIAPRPDQASFRTKFGITESDFKVAKGSRFTLDELLEEVTGGRSQEWGDQLTKLLRLAPQRRQASSGYAQP